MLVDIIIFALDSGDLVMGHLFFNSSVFRLILLRRNKKIFLKHWKCVSFLTKNLP